MGRFPVLNTLVLSMKVNAIANDQSPDVEDIAINVLHTVCRLLITLPG